ncbi:hypothetical protein D1814_09035 [Alteromonas sp. BL110]|uniref:hypothetical protein n=1 Tax=Alteromonas sp. BL110 TaxID=1714845 RepID=UPI000E536EB9|nr:hypothetical protein [Alteromonas sp. BL110]AXT38810.1 hypothetical protein D1814_09035 [Alteromonas sp. BL110]RKM83042.1 hypothetical protein D7031_03420 [Alteromonas sp. BL110]
MGRLTVRLIVLIGCLHLSHLAVGGENEALVNHGSESAKHRQPTLDAQSGLVKADGFNLVLAHCSACHSPSLITQNAMSRERWLETIRWMQETQKLWPLGDAEPLILDYLSAWYGPKKSARRAPLAPHLLPAH